MNTNYTIVLVTFFMIQGCKPNTANPKDQRISHSCDLDIRITPFIEDESSNIDSLPKACIKVYGATGLEVCLNKISNCESIVNVEAFALLLFELEQEGLLDSTQVNASTRSYIEGERNTRSENTY